MGDPKGFMKYAREGPKRKPVELRVLDWKEMYEPIAEEKLKDLNTINIEAAMRVVAGTARSMGVTVEG